MASLSASLFDSSDSPLSQDQSLHSASTALWSALAPHAASPPVSRMTAARVRTAWGRVTRSAFQELVDVGADASHRRFVPGSARRTQSAGRHKRMVSPDERTMMVVGHAPVKVYATKPGYVRCPLSETVFLKPATRVTAAITG